MIESPIVAEMTRRLVAERHVAATGQWGSCALVLAAIIQERVKRPVLVLTAHLDEADDAVDQLNFFHPGASVRLYPAFEVLPGESNISHELASQRLELLVDLERWAANGGEWADKKERADFIVAPVQALMQPSPKVELLRDLVLSIRPDDTLDRDKLVQWLADHGYTRLDTVEDAGDFAVRGDIVDVWSPGGGEGGGFPTRINFFGDTVESVHHFDLETLGPTGNIDAARLIALGDRSTWPLDQTTSLLSYLPKETIVWLIEPAEIQEQAKSYHDRLSDARGIYPPNTVLKNVQQFAWAEIHQFGGEGEGGGGTLRLPCKSVQRFDTKAEEAIRELAELAEGTGADEKRVVVVCDSKSECTRLSDLLDVKHPGVRAKIEMPVGVLNLGFEWNERGEEGIKALRHEGTEGGEQGIEALRHEGIEGKEDNGARRGTGKEADSDISRSGGMAEGNGLDARAVPGDAADASGGEIRADQPDATGGGIDSVEHRRGLRTAKPHGLHSVSPDSPRVASGVDNTGGTRLEHGDAAPGADTHITFGGRGPNSSIPDHEPRTQEQTGRETKALSALVPQCLIASPPLLLIGHHEIFHRFNQRRRLRAVSGARPIDSFLDLQPGDFVVHVHHGIARFEGMTSITREGRQSEFLTLKFAGTGDATLHVPVTQIHLVQKYVGGAHGRPPLSVLGGQTWSKQKEKVAEAVEQLAGELLEVQASREHSPGIAYPGDTVWQKEFENAFPYPPTEDQVRSVDEIKVDMARTRPMDRLLCGDVGYGKTEVAMRAAFKVIEYGKQVAVLVPTTVLAEQHEQTLRERLAGYPFIIESVSRFKTTAQVKKILERTRAGQVDILVGTHRLLSRDVVFSDLGMVIIDEEQRFGVEHKERLKKLRLSVDILTMTATPIPRTLHMSMLGIRDISNLATPPSDRRSVVTEVIPHDKERIKQALQRELARHGQIFFVHNKVYNIQSVADEIRQMVPDARIVIGHGQMEHEHELEEVMHKFIRHEADILVSTTIIESGIDIPNANTMFINEAENFGLSDLHQLRGRVGRYKHRAYCYLLLSPDKTISSTAAKRLKAMEEYASLGAGFKIALRDLEIRGAGNILGPEQSGHIAAVGYEMYCQLLEEAVKRVKNEIVEKPKEVNVDIGITGVLPKTYVDSERQRMDLYRRLSRAHSLEMLEALSKDMVDAFGPMPKAVAVMFGLAEIRILAQRWSIESIITKSPDVIFTIQDMGKLGPLLGKGVGGGAGSVRVVDAKTVHLRLPATYLEPETLINVLRNLLNPQAAAPAPQPEPPKPQAAARVNPGAGIRRRL